MQNIISDLDIYSFRKGWPKWTVIFIPFLYWTTWPIIVYRFNHWTYYKLHIPVLRQIFSLIGFLAHRFVSTFMGIELNKEAYIGKGLFIAHFANIVVSSGSKIGNYASIHQGVTLGGAGRGDKYGDPIIGNNAYIGAGAKIIGRITLGNNIMVGCNAVVTKNFSDNVTLGGIPAKIINYEGSEGFVHYRKKADYKNATTSFNNSI